MPIEFLQESQPTGSSDKNLFKLTMSYDGSGRRISKTRWVKNAGSQDWEKELVTHYTGIGTEIREEFHNGTREKVNVVVNMPQGLGRYKVADASQPADDNASRTFEWYLKNHLGSTMLVYGTVVSTDPNTADIGETKATYDYRAFGEQVTLTQPSDKVTENFTGKEHDEEIALDYFGARYLDPMLGMWISVDAKRQYPNPYLYAGDNPIMRVDPDGNLDANAVGLSVFMNNRFMPEMQTAFDTGVKTLAVSMAVSATATIATLSVGAFAGAYGSGMLAAGAAKVSGMLVASASMVGGLLKTGYGAASVAVGKNYAKIMAAGEIITGAFSGPGPVSSVPELKGATWRGLYDAKEGILEGCNNMIDALNNIGKDAVNWANERMDNMMNTDYSDSDSD